MYDIIRPPFPIERVSIQKNHYFYFHNKWATYFFKFSYFLEM